MPLAEWSKDYSACKECGKTEHPHWAKGLCKSCYIKEYHAKHKDEQKKAADRWRKRNRKKYNEYLRKYRQK